MPLFLRLCLLDIYTIHGSCSLGQSVNCRHSGIGDAPASSAASTCCTVQLVAKKRRTIIMDIPRYASAHRSAFALPEIYIQTSNPSERKAMTIRSSPNTLGSSPPSSASPMSIPNARDDDSPPPPLPPPRYVNHEREGGSGARTVDPGWEWSNSREEHGWGKPSSVKSGSSLYGSFAGYGNGIMDAVEYRRGSSASTIKSISGVDSYNSSCPKVDEGYASLSTCGSIGSTK